ncbi:hypothetical protein H6778_00860 [Candidatus Nomurabacteria bacterium]|nr:hypothetical protein [Candidatus Nomurabacteria bacterium]
MLSKPRLDNSAAPHLHLKAEVRPGKIELEEYPGVRFGSEYIEVTIVSDGRHPLHGDLGDLWRLLIVQSEDDIDRQGVETEHVSVVPLSHEDEVVSVTFVEQSDYVLGEIEPQYGLWLCVGFRNPDHAEVLQFPFLFLAYPEGPGVRYLS